MYVSPEHHANIASSDASNIRHQRNETYFPGEERVTYDDVAIEVKYMVALSTYILSFISLSTYPFKICLL